MKTYASVKPPEVSRMAIVGIPERVISVATRVS